jgi:hypothetical protein
VLKEIGDLNKKNENLAKALGNYLELTKIKNAGIMSKKERDAITKA